ncbi:division/cell wall cluster transcriptional repressor MraZ [Deefgea salmonis]|uniref:Transcriptional regulator MraZ n=1 Tax=Deefgea salmonis TaxID=2875502 RepID=A0ABS8BMN2_9NEIS|nr:division/cell wall cluster transcriptional repressor MraZ [Deefgea salmonis]MCB5196816.1 division/cell wall cluster transcriptional repressor MraZ [Deefgea salmonis]
MLGGVSSLSLDSKGRLAMPAKYRALLSAAGRLVITIDPAGCVLIYPEAQWIPVRDQLNTLSGSKMSVRRLIVGHAEEIEMDTAGRILIPATLRQRAQLNKAVALVGMGNKFELWDEAKWNAVTDSVMAMDPHDLENNMEGIVL